MRESFADKYVAPRNEAETKLAAIWQDILEVEQVGVHDDFFKLGGHSLLAVRLISAIRKEFIMELPIGHIFDYPTISLLARQLEGTRFNCASNNRSRQPRPKEYHYRSARSVYGLLIS